MSNSKINEIEKQIEETKQLLTKLENKKEILTIRPRNKYDFMKKYNSYNFDDLVYNAALTKLVNTNRGWDEDELDIFTIKDPDGENKYDEHFSFHKYWGEYGRGRVDIVPFENRNWIKGYDTSKND